jgi:hypothetical protein
MDLTRDPYAGAPPQDVADHPAEDRNAPPDEAAARTRELYAQYTENTRATTETVTAAGKRPRRSRASRNRHPEPEVSHDVIAVRAYELYAASGSPPDRDVEFWLEAERQLRKERET